MKNLILGLFCLSILIACNSSSDNATGIEENNNSSTSVVDSVDVDEKQDSIAINEETNSMSESAEFPYLSVETNANFEKGRTNKAGGGDCMMNAVEYTFENNTVIIDNIECGDYYTKQVHYWLKEGSLQLIHVAYIANIEGLWRETIYDCRTNPAIAYVREGALERTEAGELAEHINVYKNMPEKGKEVTDKDEDYKDYINGVQGIFDRKLEDF